VISSQVRFTYIGGPTILIEYGDLRFLVDPTFDPAGTDYPTPIYTLHKTKDPAISANHIGSGDAVLLSHDHHFDNLDNAGREFLKTVPRVITTKAGAARLGDSAEGFEAWETTTVGKTDLDSVKVTATPARHGPPDGDRGPVVGFVLEKAGLPTVYLSGDTVWYEEVAEVSHRFNIDIAVLFMGAAIVPEVGAAHLTFTAEEAVQAAKAFSKAVIVPVHYEGWKHFSESRPEIEKAFEAAFLTERIEWLEPGFPKGFS
jgi:L-ascorbate metabolism protein UlaG (beta-lactamase superfamily)